MATPTIAEILATFPEVAAADPTVVALNVSISTSRTAEVGVWGDETVYNYAVALRAAGMMADLGVVGAGSASAGAVTSERIGSLSVGYAGATGSPDNPMTNGYWRQLAQLQAENILAPRTSYGA